MRLRGCRFKLGPALRFIRKAAKTVDVRRKTFDKPLTVDIAVLTIKDESPFVSVMLSKIVVTFRLMAESSEYLAFCAFDSRKTSNSKGR